MMFSHGEPRCAIAVWNLHAHGNAGCTVVWQSQVVVGWKEMSLGGDVHGEVTRLDVGCDGIRFVEATRMAPCGLARRRWTETKELACSCVCSLWDREFPAPHILEGTMSCEIEPLVYLWETTPHCIVGYLCHLLASLVPGRWAMIPTPHALRSSDVILVPSPYTSPISCKGSGLLWRLPSSIEEAASFFFHITLF